MRMRVRVYRMFKHVPCVAREMRASSCVGLVACVNVCMRVQLCVILCNGVCVCVGLSESVYAFAWMCNYNYAKILKHCRL